MELSRKKKRLGDILIEQRVITEDQLKEALAYGREKKLRVGEALVDMGTIKEIDIAKALKNSCLVSIYLYKGFK